MEGIDEHSKEITFYNTIYFRKSCTHIEGSLILQKVEPVYFASGNATRM